MTAPSLTVTLSLLLCTAAACSGADKGGPGSGVDSGGASGGDSGSGTGGDDTGEVGPQGCTATSNASPLSPTTCADEAPCRWTGTQSYGYWGYALDGGQDVDGDGREDLIVGSPTWSSSTAEDAGSATLISGAHLEDGEDLGLAFVGASEGDYAGTHLVLLGDVDGDGAADALVGARGVDDPTWLYEEAGASYLLLGSPSGFTDATWSPSASWYGERAYSRMGTAVGKAGDVDGDGLADMLLSGELRTVDEDGDEAYGPGRVYLVSGQESGWSLETAADTATATWSGASDRDAAGLAMTGADLDGDGYSDVIIGAPYAGGYKGRVYLIAGGPGTVTGSADLADAELYLQGTASYDTFGWSVAAGDVTGDGVAELVVGAPLSDLAYDSGGTVSLYGEVDLSAGPSTLTSYVGEFDDHQLGMGVTLGRDIDGDGVGELVMGAVSTWQGLTTKAGKTYVVSGRDTGWPAAATPASEAGIQVHGAAVKDYLGRANALADLDGDGTADLVLGSGFTNSSSAYDSGTVYLFFGG